MSRAYCLKDFQVISFRIWNSGFLNYSRIPLTKRHMAVKFLETSDWKSWFYALYINFISISNHFCFCILDDDFKDFLKCMETDEKKIYLVDSGLSFNLPFPVTLRPQRGIELYITCDFSSRKSDSTPPFRVNF